MSQLIRLDIFLSRLAGWIAALAVIAMMLMVASDAVARQAFGTRIPFTSVIVANYLMVAIAFLPLALTELYDRHISVDLLYGRLPAGAQRVASILIHALAALTAAGLTWTMWDEALRRMNSGTVAVEDGLSLPIWQGYFLLPAGFFLLFLIYLLRVLLGLAGAPQAQHPLIADEDAALSEI